MKSTLLTSTLLAALLPALAYAGPKEDVTAAAKKLSEAESYSWTTTTEMGGGNGGGGGGNGGGGRGGRMGPIEGKTLKSGLSLITTKFGDRTTETYVKDGKTVSKGEDGSWKTPQEIAAARSADGGGNGGGGGRGRGGFGGGMFRNVKSPAEQITETSSKVEKFEEKDGAVTGTLSPEAVKAMLTFGGGRRGGDGGANRPAPPEPKETSGTVSYWLKDGAITKVETHVKGTMSFNGEDRQIDRKTTTEFSAVGSTKLEVPEEVTKKLAEAKPVEDPK